MTNLQIIGRREIVKLPAYTGELEISAKIDTGAYGSALHCEKITLDENGVLVFVPVNKKMPAQSTKKFRKGRIKSSSGHTEERFIVKTKVVIMNKSYDIDMSLTDRSLMRRPMLIGRKFLGRNNLLVNVRRFEGKYPSNLEKE